MCLGLCPYLEEMGEHVAMISDCKGEQGRCYAVCPRTDTDLDELRGSLAAGWDAGGEDYVLGPHRSIWMSRSADPAVRERTQYGGTVSALILFGLESGSIDAALLTRWAEADSELFLPSPTVARTRREVLGSAGSKYTACPTLKILDQTVRDGVARLGVVGRPCQILALRKRQRLEDPAFSPERIALSLGLFCMWSLSYREFRKWLEPALGASRIQRIDIPKGGFMVETERGRVELPHGDLLKRTRETCQQCYDFTAELADLSVGSTEWRDDWNTLIVRTETGHTLVESAAARGWIELEPFPPERERLLREAAFNKKKRVLEKLRDEARESGKEPYLRVSKREQEFFLKGE
jgi:coenzyme F420 hydrogenase subunit beta